MDSAVDTSAADTSAVDTSAVDAAVRPDRSPWPARALALAVALLVTAPVLAPGYVLLADMVFVPRQDLDLDALGLSGALPRAVPADAAVALATAVLPGSLVQAAVLLLTVSAAVLGAARLVPPGRDGRRGAAAGVAGLVYGWSPYLAERLLIGHWTLLLAWAALPWIVRAGLRLRADSPRALPWLVLAVAPAALSPTGSLLAAGALLAGTGRRRAVRGLAVVALLSAPWIVAGLLAPAAGTSDPAGVAAFAARAENWAGAVAAVLGTGGIWNGAAVPDSRASALAPLVTVLLLAVAVAGWAPRATRSGAGGRLLVLGAGGLLLAVAGVLPGTAQLLEAAVAGVPGTGLLRDGQKWAAWLALPLAVGAGLGARRLAAAVRGVLPGAGAAVAVLAALLPLVAVPDLAWGVGGRLQPVAWPADWQTVRTVLARDPAPGDVLVLPAGAYRAFGWNDGRAQLDPAARWLPRAVVADDTLVVDGRAVRGEDDRAAQVLAAAGDPARLARLGVGWVLVERGTPGPAVPAAVTGLPLVVDGADLRLHRVPGAESGPRPSAARAAAVGVAHGAAAGAVVGAALWITLAASTVALRRRSSRKRVPA
ncbi:hypothetical protein [Geodermatophilus amargosae]|uniref:hypothetical protein n=1 Tax=Geodermatophilus amargosae TaxID=1296565 RepID=UPI0034DF8700